MRQRRKEREKDKKMNRELSRLSVSEKTNYGLHELELRGRNIRNTCEQRDVRREEERKYMVKENIEESKLKSNEKNCNQRQQKITDKILLFK